jgi:hypothetical protein
MVVAPAAVASCRANAPTPPVAPDTSTVSPGFSWTASRAASAAEPANPMAPAVARSTPSGTGAMECSAGTTRYSPNPPALSGNVRTTPKTLCPAANVVTSAPTTSTVPAKSRPSTTGNRCGMIPLKNPRTSAVSNPLSDEPLTLIRMSVAPGTGVSTSVIVGPDPKS